MKRTRGKGFADTEYYYKSASLCVQWKYHCFKAIPISKSSNAGKHYML